MRSTIVGLAAFAVVAFAGGANSDTPTLTTAPDAPAGIHLLNGALADAQGSPLYTFDWDTMKGMSHCTGQCARDWPPLKAAADARPSGDWTIIIRDDGERQWAYKDKPIYTYANDTAGQPGTGEALDNWKLAH